MIATWRAADIHAKSTPCRSRPWSYLIAQCIAAPYSSETTTTVQRHLCSATSPRTLPLSPVPVIRGSRVVPYTMIGMDTDGNIGLGGSGNDQSQQEKRDSPSYHIYDDAVRARSSRRQGRNRQLCGPSVNALVQLQTCLWTVARGLAFVSSPHVGGKQQDSLECALNSSDGRHTHLFLL